MKTLVIIPVCEFDWKLAIPLIDKVVLDNCIPVIVSDGVKLPELEKYCQQYNRTYYCSGSYLKQPGYGGRWLQRILEIGVLSNSPFFLKLEPDTILETNLNDFPVNCDLFGCVSQYGILYGGLTGFSRSAARQILLSGLLLDAEFNDQKYYYLWQRRMKLIPSGDFILNAVIKRLNLVVKPWDKLHRVGLGQLKLE